METNNTLMKITVAEVEATQKDAYGTHLNRKSRDAPNKIQRWYLEGVALH